MFDLDRWQEILSTLAKNPLRTSLTAFGVFWGILMLMIMLGAGNGLKNGVLNDFTGSATNSFFLWTQTTSETYRGLPKNRRIQFEDSDIELLRTSLPEAKIISPRNQLGGFRGSNKVLRGTKSGGFSVVGDYPEIQGLESVKMLTGRFLNPIDLAERAKVAVIGVRVAEVLFEKGENPVGEDIIINGVYFRVVGTFKSDQFGGRGDGNEKIFVPFTTFQYAFNCRNFVDWFAITAYDGYPIEQVEAKALSLLKARHKVAPSDNRAIGHFNLGVQFRKIFNLFIGIEVLIWVVGTGTLLAGVIGVSNIMLIVVKERTKEIGIRRAIGARPWNIMSQIIIESIALTSVAGYVGLMAGIGILEALKSMLLKMAAANPGQSIPFKNPNVDIQTVLIALTILVVSGALAGFIPARRAISISTVDALRAD